VPEAVDDLAGAIEYLQERNPRAAVVTAGLVFDAIDKLAAAVSTGRAGDQARRFRLPFLAAFLPPFVSPLFLPRAARNDTVGSCRPNVASSAASARYVRAALLTSSATVRSVAAALARNAL
jgi:hypothetical protein